MDISKREYLQAKNELSNVAIINVEAKEVNTLDKTELESIKLIIGNNYEEIVRILKEYVEMKEEYYHLIAVWIIGTYVYESFSTFPYLFINAMRGSGKTRLLKLIKALANNGDLVTSIREAVLFRTARGKTLCIDEFEGLNKKENAPLRELLNACYKKGMKVQRMKKQKTLQGEEQVVEEFEPYTPIVMANIYGMEEVLGDRCITMILEKSSEKRVTKLMEDFESLEEIKVLKSSFLVVLVKLCSYFGVDGYLLKWNKYIKMKYPSLYTLTTLTAQTTLTTPTKIEQIVAINDDEFFTKIDETEINGRNLELFFPLFVVAKFIDYNLFEKILEICKNMTKEKKQEEMTESRDVAFIEFVSRNQEDENYTSVKKITNDFRFYLGDDQNDEPWLNTKWVGRALRRLCLTSDKRRVGEGIEVRLNVNKAKEKIKSMKNAPKN